MGPPCCEVRGLPLDLAYSLADSKQCNMNQASSGESRAGSDLGKVQMDAPVIQMARNGSKRCLPKARGVGSCQFAFCPLLSSYRPARGDCHFVIGSLDLV